MNNNHLSLLGIPLDLGAENLGVDIGPNAFRYQHIVKKLEQAEFELEDLGNIEPKERSSLQMGNPKLKYLDEIVRVSELSAKAVYQVIRTGKRMVVLGGDHSITLGIVSGASKALTGDLGILYFDAHGDMNTDKTTMTGNIHGMHMASLLGFGDSRLSQVYTKETKIKKEHFLHIGGNDFDKAELDLIDKEKLNTFMLIDLLSYGLAPLFKKIDAMSARVKNIWVSLDLDAIDSIYAPGAGMPSKAGLSYREITAIASYVGTHGNVVGVDIVEYNPLQDIEGKTAELGIELIAKFLGSNYSWYTSYLEKNKMSL